MRKPMWAGLDLAASEHRPSAIALGEAWETLQVFTVYKDDAILAQLSLVETVWVDAPLTHGKGAFRDCDRQLHAIGIAPLPLTWPSMQALHRRVLALLNKGPHAEWRETFPWSLYRYVGAKVGRKKSPHLLAQWAHTMGFAKTLISIHEWDALACWGIGWLSLQGLAFCVSGEEGAIWIPGKPQTI
ncbi:MAG: hypothetical protein N2200_05680 [Bacteroidia bacterium]|nr:hypothetical protein [Bacteroidia bacterium]MDW8417549.1 hypothetical protein [Bacteroidia bacterium]